MSKIKKVDIKIKIETKSQSKKEKYKRKEASTEKLKILLVRPWVNKNITTVKNYLFGEPIGIECVSTILKELGHEVMLVDFMVEKNATMEHYLTEFRPNVVGVTSQCTDVINVLEIAKIAKKYNKKIKVIVGGVQASCFPNSFFVDEVDYVFKSTTRENYTALMEEILNKTEAKVIEGIYSRRLGFENNLEFCLNEYIVPDRESTKKYRNKYQYMGFKPCAILQTAYGCRNRCTFCIRWKMEGPQLQEIPIEEIVAQIEEIQVPYIMIVDNDFLINEERLTKFCKLLEERNINKKYMCYGSVNSILEKPHLLGRLRKNGLMAVIVGFEAFNDERLREYNKSATVNENIEVAHLLHKYEIGCWGSFIVHPDWDKKDFKAILTYLDILKVDLVSFSPLVPHPLTPLYEEYKERLIYSIEEYDKWNFGDVLIYPSKMSLKDYYVQVLLLGIKMNLNAHSLRYIQKTIPLKDSIKMSIGFESMIRMYLKNIKKAQEDGNK